MIKNWIGSRTLGIWLAHYPSLDDRFNKWLLQSVSISGPYGLFDFTNAQLIQPGVPHCVAVNVESADKLDLVIASVRLDAKHAR
jgi:hypothetical protein